MNTINNLKHMKMGAGLFLGVIIILIGLSIIFKGLPIFRIIIGALLIFWGLKVIMGGFGKPIKACHFNTKNDVIFSEQNFHVNDGSKEYNVVFGKGVYDLRSIQLNDKPVYVKFNTVFGGSEIILGGNQPFRITAEAVFGGAQLPNGNTTAFGTSVYQSDNFKADSGYIDLKIDVVFGGVNFSVR